MDYIDYRENKGEMHFWYSARLLLIREILCLLGSGNSNKILSLGCGTGTELEILKNFGNVTAIDKNQEALEIAKKTGCEILLADIENSCFEKEKYDIITCFDVLEHLENDFKILGRIHSSLKANGYLVLTVPAYQFLFGPHDRALKHFRRYDKAELIRATEKIGFTVVKANYWNTLLFPLEMPFRLIKKLILKNKSIPDSRTLPKAVNALFYQILKLENHLVKTFFKTPFGLSLYIVAKK